MSPARHAARCPVLGSYDSGTKSLHIKHVIKFCHPSYGEMGLVRLSKELGVEWEGDQNHLAGQWHNSLLTALMFVLMEKVARQRMVALLQFRRPAFVRLAPCAPPFGYRVVNLHDLCLFLDSL